MFIEHLCMDLHALTCICVHVRAYAVVDNPFGLTFLYLIVPQTLKCRILNGLEGRKTGSHIFVWLYFMGIDLCGEQLKEGSCISRQ